MGLPERPGTSLKRELETSVPLLSVRVHPKRPEETSTVTPEATEKAFICGVLLTGQNLGCLNLREAFVCSPLTYVLTQDLTVAPLSLNQASGFLSPEFEE